MPALRLAGATYAVPVPLDSTDVPSRLNSGDENSSRASISRSACRLLCEHLPTGPGLVGERAKGGQAPEHTALSCGQDLPEDNSKKARPHLHNNEIQLQYVPVKARSKNHRH